jgi:hypothetical protein
MVTFRIWGTTLKIPRFHNLPLMSDKSEIKPMRNFWKILSVALFFAFAVLFLVTVSMYWWPGIPSSPQPLEGRIYPLNNHAHYTYMNRAEYDLRERMYLAIKVLIVTLALVQWIIDPFEYKKTRLSDTHPSP